MSNLFKRFGIIIQQQDAQRRFKNIVKNLLTCGEYYEIFDEEKVGFDIVWIMANKFGFDYGDRIYPSSKYDLIFSVLSFEEYLARLQYFIDNTWKYVRTRDLSLKLALSIQDIIQEFPAKLGIKIVFYKNKSPQIYPTGIKIMDEEIEEVLGGLERENYSNVLEQFESGLKEFLNATNDQQLKNVVEDMLSSWDLLMHKLFNDKNIGFKHLFKNDRWKQIGLNSYQKQILWCLKEWMDKIKHSVIEDFSREDVEQIIYLTSIGIHFIVNNYVPKS